MPLAMDRAKSGGNTIEDRQTSYNKRMPKRDKQ
jgi:hypothetical protein